MSDIQNRLFRDEDFEDVKLTPEKIVCLGMEFPSDEARREYFREELRKKLPELKKIEGYPIGEDDDIINLSDPPYYTACPNPWLNDFIDIWEKEKGQLEEEGKRLVDFEVKQPYASDVSEGKNNPIYMAHSYHTKVPHPAIMRYILHYTQPGDIIFDGFCGSGMTAVAAQLCGSKNDVLKLKTENIESKVGIRHAICSDLSPIASLISASYNLKFNEITFEQKANEILSKVEQELGWMYETKVDGIIANINYVIWSDVYSCPNCGKNLILWNETVSKDTKSIKQEFSCPSCGSNCSKKSLSKVWFKYYDTILNTTASIVKKVPVRINYTCKGKRREKDISSFDLDVLNKIDSINISNLHTTKIKDGDKMSDPLSRGIKYIHQFYTKRNYILLNRLLELAGDDISLIKWITSVLLVTTKMYAFRTDRKGGIMKGTLYVPSYNIELNPIHSLKNKIKGFVETAYSTRGNSTISINSATNLQNIKDNSIDYIFTDPPFGSNLMYSELSFIWDSWIKILTNSKEEAIINKSQNKSLLDYQSLINRSLKECYRILKPGRWFTMEFSNTSAAVWNCIQNALQGVGFVLSNVSALDKRQGSFNAITSTTAVKQDLVITCYKPSSKLVSSFKINNNKDVNVVSFIEELLIHLPIHIEKDNYTTSVIERSSKILYDRLVSYYVQNGYPIPMDSLEFQTKLKDSFIERDGMFFTASQVVEYEEKKKATVGTVPMALFISNESEGIEWLKRELEEPQTYSDIQPKWMKDLVKTKKGDILPELSQILEENFIKDENGKWRKPDAEKAADLEALRSNRLKREFDVYVEQAKMPRARRMNDTRLEVLRYGFKECYQKKDFKTIILVGDHIQEALLQEDEVLLQYYDIASMRV